MERTIKIWLDVRVLAPVPVKYTIHMRTYRMYYNKK
jgi:hypothetical protein